MGCKPRCSLINPPWDARERPGPYPINAMQRFFMPVLGALSLAATATAQVEFATSVVSFNMGTGSGIFDQNLILGGPQGGAGIDVLSLGVNGNVTLGFDVTITNGPGADFIIFENGFEFDGLTFPEMVMVEVSSNGIDFARFPLRYNGPQMPLGAFDGVPWGVYSGMAGLVPPLANVLTNSLDPRNPVEAGGEALDMDDLAEEPLVLMGLVDLDAIQFLRLIDIESGTVVDSRGVTIYDTGGPDGNADIDAVSVIHHTGNQNASGPRIDFTRDAMNFANLEISDPNGLSDLNLGTLQVSVNNEPIPFGRLREFFVLTQATSTSLFLRTPLPLTEQNFNAVMSVSVEDQTGLFSADQISLNR